MIDQRRGWRRENEVIKDEDERRKVEGKMRERKRKRWNIQRFLSMERNDGEKMEEERNGGDIRREYEENGRMKRSKRRVLGTADAELLFLYICSINNQLYIITLYTLFGINDRRSE